MKKFKKVFAFATALVMTASTLAVQASAVSAWDILPSDEAEEIMYDSAASDFAEAPVEEKASAPVAIDPCDDGEEPAEAPEGAGCDINDPITDAPEEMAEYRDSKGATVYTYGDYQYIALSNTTAEIYGYTGSDTMLTIPSKLGGKKVTSIGNYAFDYCDSFVSVTIPSTVTNIGYEAFYNCDDLTTLKIPNTVKTLGENCFAYCDKLTSVVIGTGITTVAESAFYNCTAMTNLTIGANVKTIGASAFAGCNALMKLTIPSKVTTIDSYAFSNCDAITSVTVPNSVKTLGYGAFNDCDSLLKAKIGTGVTSMGGRVFYHCPKLTGTVLIPYGVEVIGESAFSECYELTGVIIPKSIKTIGEYAFYNCYKLANVTIPNSVTSIGQYAFKDCDTFTSIVIPGSVKSIGYRAFRYCTNVTSVTVKDGVNSIGDAAFEECKNLKKAVIADTVDYLGDYVFKNCYALSDVSLGEGVTSIGVEAFYDCDALKSIVLGYNISYIGAGAFRGCNNLNKITIPDAATYIGDRAFANCNTLYDVYYQGTATDWDLVYIGSENGYLTGATFHCKTVVQAPTPYDLIAKGGLNKVAIAWSEVRNATKYAIYILEDGKWSLYKNTTRTSYSIPNLTAGKTYGFLVRSYSNGKWSTFTADDYAYATPTGTKPHIYSVTPGLRKATLEWTGVTGASRYAVYYYKDGKHTLYKNTTATSITVTGLSAATKYGFVVRAYVNGKWTSFTAADRKYATIMGTRPVITATAVASNRATIVWSGVEGATRYAVYTYLNGKFTLYKTTTGESCAITGLRNGTKYGFLVRAYINGAWTSYLTSDIKYATPLA